MSVKTTPPRCIGKHDINAGLQGVWTIEIELPAGESLIGPATVIAVALDGTDTALDGDSLVISAVTIGQISVSPNFWGISFKTQAGAARKYWLRGAAQRNTSPPFGVHRTVELDAGNN